jgi:acetylserotonin N-methyltransferase
VALSLRFSDLYNGATVTSCPYLLPVNSTEAGFQIRLNQKIPWRKDSIMTTTPPDPSIVLDLMEAFRRSKTMFAAVSLGAFDALASGPKTLPELTRELGTNPDGLERLLDACVGLQLLQRGVGGYANAPVASAYLSRTSPHRLTGYINFSNEYLWKLWANLEDAVREGGHRWKQTYGLDGPIFSHFFRTKEAAREFLLGMHGLGQLSSPHVVAVFDLSRFRQLVDLGGATGHLSIAACQGYPYLRATVFDLADAMPLAREVVEASPVADRITLVTGDFFTDPLPAADLFALGRILHDWTEEKILRLLARIVDRLPPRGALLIAEKLLDEGKTGPRSAQMQDLNMLTATEGKERTLSEYEALLKRAGFVEVRGSRTNAPVDAILAVKG